MNSEDNTKGTTSCDSLSSIHQDFDQMNSTQFDRVYRFAFFCEDKLNQNCKKARQNK